MKEFNEIKVKSESGEISIAALSAKDAEEAAALYDSFKINRENYKARLGMLENDDFYAMGGKYEELSAEDFRAMAESEGAVILGARGEGKLFGLIWADFGGEFFEGLDGFEFKPEYAGLLKMWKRMLGAKQLVGGLESICRAPESFPSAAAALHHAMIGHLAENGAEMAAGLIYKNIWCREDSCGAENGAGGTGYREPVAGAVRNLDTFDYNAYNAYKMLGYEHVGNQPRREASLPAAAVTVCVEPQIIAALDLTTQLKLLTKILEDRNIRIL